MPTSLQRPLPLEKINHHIKTLLSAHDCVIVPDFGAFIADYSPAVVSDEKSTIPSKDILFNRNLTRNDGLLINALIEEEGLEYTKAKEEIARYVSEINALLAKGEKVAYDGIGTLSLDEAGFVQFVSDDSNTCLLDAYGLQSVTLEKIDHQDAPAVTLPEESSNMSSRRVILRVASVAAVVALILIFSIPLSDQPISDYAALGFDSSTPDIVTNSTPVSKLKDGKSAYTNGTTSALPIENEEVASLPLSRKTPEEKEQVVLPQKTYHIIIASLATETMADNYVETFQRKYDFDSVEKLSGGGRYRISVAHFDQQNEAVAFVKSLRLLNPKFGDAWVLPLTSN